MTTIYLAGLISTECMESLRWRAAAAHQLRGRAVVLSPTRGKDMTSSKDGGITVDAASGTSRDCIMRDYNDLARSDVVMVNLNQWGSERPMIGTMFELGWAWLLKKPVVAICGKDDYLMRQHPFVKEAVTHYCGTLEEALEFIGRYYL